MKMRLLTMLGGALLATPALAQDDSARLLDAIDLPAKADAARAMGVPAAEVAEALDAARSNGLGASGANALLITAGEVGADFGGGFGAFVKEQVAAGKRGKDLADAIHAEAGKRRGGGAAAAPSGNAGGAKKADPPPHDRHAGKDQPATSGGDSRGGRHDRHAGKDQPATSGGAGTTSSSSDGGHDRHANKPSRDAATPAPEKTKGGK